MARCVVCAVILCSGASIPFCFGEPLLPPVTSPPAALTLDPFYAKYLDCGGISVIGSDAVSDEAFYRLKELLDKMLENRPDVRRQLAQDGNRFIIIGRTEQVTDVPDYAHMEPKAFWNERARGFGGRTTSVGEENLLSLPEDRYEDESIFIHELAHSIHFVLRRLEPDFQATLARLYQNAMDKGLYQYDYASTNASEYWAEAVQGFFDANRANNWNHNHISTREQLTEYDPDIVELVRKTFRITPENDWRYEPLAVQPSVHPTPDRFAEARTLPKYVWCRGFSIFGTAEVSDEALLCVDQTIRNLFRYRHDILKALIDADVAVVVYADDELPSDVPVHKTLSVASFLQHEEPQAAVALPTSLRLGVAQSEIVNADGCNPLIGRLALAAYLYTGLRPIDPTFDQRRQKQQYEIGLERMDIRFDRQVQALYTAAVQKGVWAAPAADNRFDYFAQGVQAFFDAHPVVNGQGRAIPARQRLKQVDPELAALVGDLFKHPERYDWRHTPCSQIAGP